MRIGSRRLNRLYFVLDARPRFFLGARLFGRWCTLKPADDFIPFIDRNAWQRVFMGLRLTIKRFSQPAQTR